MTHPTMHNHSFVALTYGASLLAFLGCFMAPLWAHAEVIFDTSPEAQRMVMEDYSVIVDVGHENEPAAQSKAKALAQGQAMALAQFKQALPTLSPQLIKDAIASFEILDESTTSTSYKAQVRYLLDPQVLVAQGLAKIKPPTMQTTETMLIVPMVRQNNQDMLWVDTPWTAAWQSLKPAATSKPVIVPQGDLNDARILSATMARQEIIAAFEALKAKYKATQAAVVVAEDIRDFPTSDADDTGLIGLRVTFLDGMPNSAATPSASITVIRNLNEDLKSFYQRSVQQTLDLITAEKKKAPPATATPTMPPQEEVVTVHLTSMHDWPAIAQKLERAKATTNMVSSVPQTVSAQSATILMKYHGRLQDIQEQLRSVGFSLVRSIEGQLELHETPVHAQNS